MVSSTCLDSDHPYERHTMKFMVWLQPQAHFEITKRAIPLLEAIFPSCFIRIRA